MSEDLLNYLDKIYYDNKYNTNIVLNKKNNYDLNELFKSKYNNIKNHSYKYYFDLIFNNNNEKIYNLIILDYIYFYDKNNNNTLLNIIKEGNLNSINDNRNILLFIKIIDNNKEIFISIDKKLYIDLIFILLNKNKMDKLTIENYNNLKKNHNGIIILIKDILCYLYKKNLLN